MDRNGFLKIFLQWELKCNRFALLLFISNFFDENDMAIDGMIGCINLMHMQFWWHCFSLEFWIFEILCFFFFFIFDHELQNFFSMLFFKHQVHFLLFITIRIDVWCWILFCKFDLKFRTMLIIFMIFFFYYHYYYYYFHSCLFRKKKIIAVKASNLHSKSHDGANIVPSALKGLKKRKGMKRTKMSKQTNTFHNMNNQQEIWIPSCKPKLGIEN